MERGTTAGPRRLIAVAVLALVVGVAGGTSASASAVRSSSAFTSVAHFPDAVCTTHAGSIRAVTDNGTAGGFEDGTFRPGEAVTRGQMATFLAQALELNPGSSDAFPDVVGTTHESSILAVAEGGITGGFADGTFRPGEAVTRGQMATFLAHGFDLAPADSDPFSDVAGTTHEASVLAVAEAGITGGFADGTFRPWRAVTRGQMATFLANALGLEVRAPGPRFTVGPGVAAADEQLGRDAIDEAVSEIRRLTGYATCDFDIFIYDDPVRIAEAHCAYFPQNISCERALNVWENEFASAGARGIFIRTGHQQWKDGHARVVLYQEYIRVLEWQLPLPAHLVVDGDVVPPAGPQWLGEGNPEYLATLMVEDGFPHSRANMRRHSTYDQPGRPTLRSLETGAGMFGDVRHYRLAQFAVYLLIEDFDVQLPDLLTFYRGVALGLDWQDSFLQTFGVSIDAFYDHFENL